MKDNAKKRTKSQKIGARGENAFRCIASKVGLLPTKVEEDYGLDFYCQVDIKQSVSGFTIGAAVRTSETSKGRVSFTRKDIENLLSYNIPVLVILCHIHNNNENVYVRLLDENLAVVFAQFLDSGKKELSLTPNNCLDSSEIPNLVQTARSPNFSGSLKTAILSHGLGKVLPNVKIQIINSTDGQISFVRTTDFISQFDKSDDSMSKLRLALFGSPKLLHERIQQIPINDHLVSHLEDLPQPVIIAGTLHEAEVTLTIQGHEKNASCRFTQRSAGDHFAFIHTSGFYIQISQAKPFEGKMVHMIEAAIDPSALIHLHQHQDLYNFLRHCTKGKYVIRKDSSFKIPVDKCGNLGLFGAFAFYLADLNERIPWIKDTIHLGNASSYEVLNTLAILVQFICHKQSFEGFGFTIVQEDNLPSKIAHVRIPIIANLDSKGIVMFIDTKCNLMLKDGHVAGLKILKIENVKLKIVDSRFDKSSDKPELIVCKQWGAICLGPSYSVSGSNVSAWGYEAEIRDAS